MARYEKQRAGLGFAFEAEVRAAIALVEENPKAGAPHGRKCRFQVVRRFPYVIDYEELNEIVFIAAIAHGSRRPGYWKRRRLRS